jgi:uncharacterized protein
MRVAVIGASNNHTKFGNKAVRAYLAKGHAVFPVNPRESEVEGIRCYKSVLDIPGSVDLALLYVPPSIGEALVGEIAKKGIKTAYFNPGTVNLKLKRAAAMLGIEVIFKCAIKEIGLSPDGFP